RYPDNVEQRRIGSIARRSVNKIETTFRSQGLDPVWESGRLTRLNVRPANVPGLRSVGVDVRGIETGSPYVVIDPPGTNPRTARTNLTNVTKSLSLNDIKIGKIALRNLRAKAGI